VQSNRLTEVKNLQTQVNTLEELYLAHNGIDDAGASSETGIALPFTELSTLDMGRNRLTTTRMFSHLLSLNDLWLGGNQISSFDDIMPIAPLGTGKDACLEEIYLEYNPIASDFEYRKRVKEILPSLEKIDADMIHGYPSGASLGQGTTTEEEGRRLQEEVIARAKAETKGA
jgi:protein phosphatase 1 regulatory subunit 7